MELGEGRGGREGGRKAKEAVLIMVGSLFSLFEPSLPFFLSFFLQSYPPSFFLHLAPCGLLSPLAVFPSLPPSYLFGRPAGRSAASVQSAVRTYEGDRERKLGEEPDRDRPVAVILLILQDYLLGSPSLSLPLDLS